MDSWFYGTYEKITNTQQLAGGSFGNNENLITGSLTLPQCSQNRNAFVQSVLEDDSNKCSKRPPLQSTENKDSKRSKSTSVLGNYSAISLFGYLI